MDPALDETFAVMHLLSIVCRAIILAHNAMEKKGVNIKTPSSGAITFAFLLSHLPLGTKSDVANLLLESLEHWASVLNRRFDLMWFASPSAEDGGPSPSSSSYLPSSSTSSLALGVTKGPKGGNLLLEAFRGRVALQATPRIPALALFRAISHVSGSQFDLSVACFIVVCCCLHLRGFYNVHIKFCHVCISFIRQGLPLQSAEETLFRLFPAGGHP